MGSRLGSNASRTLRESATVTPLKKTRTRRGDRSTHGPSTVRCCASRMSRSSIFSAPIRPAPSCWLHVLEEHRQVAGEGRQGVLQTPDDLAQVEQIMACPVVDEV